MNKKKVCQVVGSATLLSRAILVWRKMYKEFLLHTLPFHSASLGHGYTPYAIDDIACEVEELLEQDHLRTARAAVALYGSSPP